MTPQQEYELYRTPVLRFLRAGFSDLADDERHEVCHDAFLALLSARQQGRRVDNPEAYLITCARTAAVRRLTCADARRRVTFDPHQGPYATIPDSTSSPEEAALSADESRRVRMLVESLPAREKAVLKLRFEQELDVAEIRARLGLTTSQYRRAAKRAAAALLQGFLDVEAGAWSKRQRSLLSACLLGIASARQERAANRLLQDPHCRALLLELRGFGRNAAAALPASALASQTEVRQRLGELLGSIKGQAVDAATAVKQNGAAAYYRAVDPTPLAGVRPGAAATVLASCLALSGGAGYCIDKGVDPIGGLVDVVQRAPAKPAQQTPAQAPPAEPPRDPPELVDQQVPAPTPPATTPTAEPQSAPAPPPPEPEPSPVEDDFGTEAAASAAAQPAPTTPARPAPAPQGQAQFGP